MKLRAVRRATMPWRGFVVILLALLFAGCGGGPYIATNSTFSDPTPLSARAHAAQVVASAFYLTFDGGVSAFPHAELGGCALNLNGTIAASGQTYGKDCGALSAGTKVMRLSQTSGSVQLRVTVNATVRVCEPANTSSSCEPP